MHDLFSWCCKNLVVAVTSSVLEHAIKESSSLASCYSSSSFVNIKFLYYMRSVCIHCNKNCVVVFNLSEDKVLPPVHEAFTTKSSSFAL